MKLNNINMNKYFHMIPLWKSPIKLPLWSYPCGATRGALDCYPWPRWDPTWLSSCATDPNVFPFVRLVLTSNMIFMSLNS